MNEKGPSPRILIADSDGEHYEKIVDLLRESVFHDSEVVEQVDILSKLGQGQSVSDSDFYIVAGEHLNRLAGRIESFRLAARRLGNLASRDSLTGLLNRRAFEEIYAQYYNDASTGSTKICCCVCDLDDFKQVNDTLGHKAGDRFLTRACRIIRNNLRETDLAVRYGGDEFLILFAGISANQAKDICRRIQDEIIWNCGHYCDARSKVTISFGLSEFDPSQPVSPDGLIEQADKALYKAKESGKDCTVIYDPQTCGIPGKIRPIAPKPACQS